MIALVIAAIVATGLVVAVVADRVVAPLERRRRALRVRSARWQARREALLAERSSRA